MQPLYKNPTSQAQVPVQSIGDGDEIRASGPEIKFELVFPDGLECTKLML
jgi:hypothetical protein